MATQKERFLRYLQTCVKSTRATESNPLLLGGNAPKDYVRFLESDRLFDYNPSKWQSTGSMYDITDYDKALEIFNELISDNDFIRRDKNDNQGWRRGAISHYVCFLSAEKFFRESNLKPEDRTEIADADALTSPLDPLQKIVYGAPGTGKSHSTDGEIKKVYPTKANKKGFVFRNTFHPDSDYSTFVGCYKPTMGKPQPIYGFDSVGHTVKAEDSAGTDVKRQEITYQFTAQSFTKSYIAAWKALLNKETLTDKDGKEFIKPVFLVIEEINRGNCAQIFGDLFQLLDRDKNGFSTYPIKPDTDLGNYIREELAKEGLTSSKYPTVFSGEELILPNNLYIWATMNTSDQSLFPIDSAFKRRWDWKYVPINTEAKSGWKIVVGGKNYSWSSFLDKINEEIDSTTSSEDKQLGFFFCKADNTDEDDNNGTISAEKFVGKVLFYLYNDVFKDYGLDQEFFKDKSNGDKKISFRSLFQMNGDINESQVAKLLENLGVEILEASTNDEDFDDEDDSENPSSGKDYTRYTVNGEGNYPKKNLSLEAVRKYVELHPEMTAEEVVEEWMTLGNIVSHFVETEAQFTARTDSSKRSQEVMCGDSKIYVAWNGWGNGDNTQRLIDAVNNKDWGITLAAK